MGHNCQCGKRINKLLLLAIAVIAFVLIFTCLFLQNNSTQTTPVAYGANQPTYSMGTVVTFDTNTKYNSSNPSSSPDSLMYSQMTVDNSGHITATQSANRLEIGSTNNLHFEALYADLSASITIPAWYEYEVEYVFSISFTRIGGKNGGYFDFFDFDSETITGKDVGFEFACTTLSNFKTTPQTYTQFHVDDERELPTKNSPPYTYEYRVTKTYKNDAKTSKTEKQNFGVFAVCTGTTSNNSYIESIIEVNSNITEKKLSVTKPTRDTAVFAYNGSAQTYQPTFPNLADSSRMRLTSDSASLTQTTVGTYKIKYEPIDYPWDDGTTTPVEFDFVINKGNLDIGITYDKQGQTRFVSDGLPKHADITFTGANKDVAGTFIWNAGQTPSPSVSSYKWTFTPTDQDNWNVKSGTESITFKNAKVTGLLVEITDSNIYDRYYEGDYGSLEAYLKDHISVKVKSDDGTTSALPDGTDFVITNEHSDFFVTSGGPDDETTEVKTINVKLTSSDSSLNGLLGSVDATVKKAVIKSISADQKTGAQTLKYPVTLDDIKANYDVSAVWNYENRALLMDASTISVEVEKDSANPDGAIKAGNIKVKFTYNGENGLTKTTSSKTVSIAKGDIDMSGVTFSNKSEMYDGTAKSIEISGTLPAGVTGVTYTCANTACSGGCTSAGTHTITAKFTYDSDNYNPVADMTATLTITNSGFDMTGVTFANDTLTYDGNGHTLEISGTLPDNRITVTYVYEKGGVVVNAPNGVIDAGVYTVTAKFTNPDPANYADIPDMTATLTIEKASYDMSGVTFENNTFTYDGEAHTVLVGGNLPNGLTVNYSVTGQTETSFKNAGVYEFTASFTNSDSTNYNDVADMTATLTINKATFDMSGITFADKTVTENGTTSFTLEITGNLPHPSIVVTYTVSGTSETSFKTAGVYEFTASFSNPDSINYNNIADMTATLTVEANPDITPTPPNNNGGLLEKIRELVDSGFPLWQICTMAVAGLLALIFLIKSIQYGNRKKAVKNEIKKIKARTYAGFLPVFSTEVVLAGLSNQIWSIMAFAFVGLAVLMFLIAIITRSAWKKAELAKENALDEREQRKYEAQENKQLALQERITQIGQNGVTVDNSLLEQRLLEMEARRREEEERHRQELAELREEQAKRDEAMKIMLAKMMGRSQDDGDMTYYGTVDDTDLLVQKVIAGLLPAVQQMMPENTAYLTAPAYEQSENDIEAIADRVAEKLGAVAPATSDNSEEIKALTDEVKDLKKQLAKGAKAETNIDVDDIADKVAKRITPARSDVNVDDIVQKVSEKITTTTNNTTIVQDVSEEKMQALNAKIAQMQQQMDNMAFLSVDELDDTDFDDEEEWDSILDEDDDDFVESVLIEEGGTVRKTTPNFRMRLKQSSEKNREWYTVIKNMFCSQKGVTYRVCKRVEKIRYQGQVVGVIGIAKRSIKLWLALKPYEYDARRYHHKDVSDKPRFVDVPMYIRVGSDRALTRSQELILALFQELNMESRKRYNDRDIQELIFTLKHNKLLTNKQNKQLLCEVMHVHDCDILSDELAEKCVEFKNVDFIDDSLLATVKLDDIDAKFQDGNRVTLDKLKKVGLVSEECTGFTVTADKRLTKPLIIVANDFTLTAVKLITLTGGRAIKLTQV